MSHRVWRLRHVADGGVVAVCAVAAVWPGLQSGLFDGGTPYLDRRAPFAVDAVIGAMTGAAVLVRRRRPELLSAGALLSWAVTGAYPAVLIAQFTVGAHAPSSWRKVALSAVTVLAVGWPLWRVTGGDGSVPLSVALCLLPALVGLYLTSRREVMANLEERARRNEREERLRIEQARAEERAQIARDMHDVVTHRVSLMVLHATALESAGGRGAAEIAGRIQSIGRSALEELRTLVGVLRDDTDAPLRPQPGLADLAELVVASRALGMTVELLVEDGLHPPSLVEHAIYRVVQEALTNVHRHAGSARTEVRVESRSDVLELSVRNDGPASGARPSADAAATLPGGGHGLLGIAERVRLVGGALRSRGLPDGGFEVVAVMPMALTAAGSRR